MSGLQITLGAVGGTNWPEVIVTALVPAAVGAGSALLGVWLTNVNAAHKHEIELSQQSAIANKARTLAALHLARHLEGYAYDLAEVIDARWDMQWVEPGKWVGHFFSQPVPIKPLGDWPDTLVWTDLYIHTVIEASNFKDAGLRQIQSIVSQAADLDPEVAYSFEAYLAAELCLQAMDIATRVRKEHGIDQFRRPSGWDILGMARTYIAEHDRRERLEDGPE